MVSPWKYDFFSTTLFSRSNNHCLGFYELESKVVKVNIHEFGLVFLKGC